MASLDYPGQQIDLANISQACPAWNVWEVPGWGAGKGRVTHVHQEGPLVDDLGAAGRGAEQGSPRRGGVVGRHILLTGDHHPPGGNVLRGGGPGHGRGGHGDEGVVRVCNGETVVGYRVSLRRNTRNSFHPCSLRSPVRRSCKSLGCCCCLYFQFLIWNNLIIIALSTIYLSSTHSLK